MAQLAAQPAYFFICSSLHLLAATTRLHRWLVPASSHCVCLLNERHLVPPFCCFPLLAFSQMAFNSRWRVFSRVWTSHSWISSLNTSPLKKILLVMENETHITRRVWSRGELGVTWWELLWHLRCVPGAWDGVVWGWSYLSKQEGNGSKGKRPAVIVAKVRLVGFGSVQHFVVDVGDVENQSNHQRETCERYRIIVLCASYNLALIKVKKLTEPLFIFLCWPRAPLGQFKDNILYIRKLENYFF